MTPTTTRLSLIAALSLSASLLTGCGAGGADTTNRYGGACVDYQGFPVPCNTPGAMPAHGHKPEAQALTFPLSSNGGAVGDASGDLLTFDAAEPHLAFVAGEPAADLSLDRNGRVLHRGLPIGWVVYVRGEQGGQVTALVDDSGRALDVVPGPSGVEVERGTTRPELAEPGSVPTRPEVASQTRLPVALPALTNAE